MGMNGPSLKMVEVQKVDEVLLSEFFYYRLYTQGSLYLPKVFLVFPSAVSWPSLSTDWSKEPFHPTGLSPV